jgi:hypothetical protein
MAADPFEKAAVRLLSVLIQLTGWTRQEVDDRLGFGRGYTSRLLTGNCKLLYRHVLAILEAIGIAPAFYFDVLHGTGPVAGRSRPAGQPNEADTEARIREAARLVVAEIGRPARAPGAKPRRKKSGQLAVSSA